MSSAIPDGTFVFIGDSHADRWGYSVCVGKTGEILYHDLYNGGIYAYSVAMELDSSLS